MPFGITTGTDAQVWFTDHAVTCRAWRGCSGSRHCAVGRVTPSGQIAELRRGLRQGGQPLGIAAGAGGEIWFADSAGAIGQIGPGGQITEHTRGLRTGSSPVAIAAGPDGDMWFTDEGQMPAVGRVTAEGAIREFSAGVPTGAGGGDRAGRRAAGCGSPTRGALRPSAWSRSGPRRRSGRRPTSPWRPGPARRPPAQPGALPPGWDCGPRPPPFRFDGIRWLLNGTLLGGHRRPQFTPSRHDAGARLACRETVTYPPPLNVTVAATSPPRAVKGAPAPAPATSVLQLTA